MALYVCVLVRSLLYAVLLIDGHFCCDDLLFHCNPRWRPAGFGRQSLTFVAAALIGVPCCKDIYALCLPEQAEGCTVVQAMVMTTQAGRPRETMLLIVGLALAQ